MKRGQSKIVLETVTSYNPTAVPGVLGAVVETYTQGKVFWATWSLW